MRRKGWRLRREVRTIYYAVCDRCGYTAEGGFAMDGGKETRDDLMDVHDATCPGGRDVDPSPQARAHADFRDREIHGWLREGPAPRQ